VRDAIYSISCYNANVISSSKLVAANKLSPNLRLRVDARPQALAKPDVAEPYYPSTCVRAIARQLQAVEQ
jgi:hypothetical protein